MGSLIKNVFNLIGGASKFIGTDANGKGVEYTDAQLRTAINVADGATANDSDANLKNTDNHISGSTNKVFTATEQAKLAGIEASATADQTGTEIKALYEAEANTNAYTDSEKAKLGSIDAAHYGTPVQNTTALTALLEANLTDKERRYVEDELSDYFYDSTAVSGDLAPNDQTGGTGFWRKVAVGGETASSIKTKYESNADTNAFTDAEQSKVANALIAEDIDTLAELNAIVTDATLIDAASLGAAATSNDYNDLNNLPSLGTAAASDTTDFAAASHVHALADLDTSVTGAQLDALKTKSDFISVTQPVDLDQLENDVAALVNGMVYKDDWDASSGSFPGAGAAKVGWYYNVSVAGTVDGVAFAIGDSVIAKTDNASTTTYSGNWVKKDQTDAVQSVAGLIGTITDAGLRAALNVADGATANDTDANLKSRANHTGTQAISTIAGLQTILDATAPLSSPAFTDVPTAPTAAPSTNTSQIATTAFVTTAIGVSIQPYDEATAKLDLAQVWSVSQIPDSHTIPFASTIADDWQANKEPVRALTVTGDVTSFTASDSKNVASPSDATEYIYSKKLYAVKMDGTGDHTFTFSGIGGTEPVIDTTANAVTLFEIEFAFGVGRFV